MTVIKVEIICKNSVYFSAPHFQLVPLTTFALATALVVYHVYHTRDLLQRPCAYGSLLIAII